MARKTFDDKKLYEINDRFKIAFDELVPKIGRTQLAKEIGYNTTRQLYNIFDNNSLVPMTALYYLSSKYNVSLDWLFEGKGEMFKIVSFSIEELEIENKNLRQKLARTKADLVIMSAMEKMKSEMARRSLMSEDEKIIEEADYYDNIYEEMKNIDDSENLTKSDKKPN